jgi:hypothetical protein
MNNVTLLFVLAATVFIQPAVNRFKSTGNSVNHLL